MEKKKITAFEIATWFINRVHKDEDYGEYITPLKLQKLLYYAQSWYLVYYDKPLFEEKILAWVHGPVVEEVYQKYKNKKWENLPVENLDSSFDKDTKDYLESVYRHYGGYRAKELEEMTHKEDPWVQARKGISPELSCDEEIDIQTMKKFYGQRLEKKEKNHL